MRYHQPSASVANSFDEKSKLLSKQAIECSIKVKTEAG